MSEHYTEVKHEGRMVRAGEDEVAEARRLHHLATADPEPERGDGTLTGPAHERKYGLEREADSAERWLNAGVDPYNNGALLEDTAGDVPAERSDVPAVENTAAAPAPEVA